MTKRNTERVKFFVAHLWEGKNTTCPDCARQMYFPRFEAIQAFIERIPDRGRLGERIFLELRQATVDHLTPLGQGGSDQLENYEGVCSWCNARRAGYFPFKIQALEDHE